MTPGDRFPCPVELPNTRITLVGINYSPEVTGIGPYTSALAEGLAARGAEVTVLTGLPHYPQWRVDQRYRRRHPFVENIGSVTVVRLPHHVPERPNVLSRLRMELSFTKAVLRRRLGTPDLLIAVSPPLISSTAVVAYARARRIPVGVIVQDIYSAAVTETGALSGARAPARALRWMESRTVRAATGVATIHERFVTTLSRLGAPRAKMTVIRNWTHVAQVSQSNRQTTRAAQHWNDDEVVVVHSGNMGVKQGLHHVVEAARLADFRGDRVRFVMIGDGNRRQSVEVAAVGVRSVEFLDPLPEDEYLAILAAADVLLVNELPGVSEMAVPSKLTSYFASGRPILAATDLHGVTADEIRSSRAGVVVPAGDPAVLLDAALALASDIDAAAAFGSRGRDYAGTALDADRALDRYATWCTDLMIGRA